MLLGGIAPLTIIPWTRKVSYVTERDFVPIGTVWRSAQTLVVRSSLGVKTMAEFVAYAKANSDKVTIGSAGIGTVSHLGSELLQRVAAIKLIHVPFRSTSESMPQVLGGQIDGLFGDASTVAAQVNAGKAIALGVAAPQRSPALPDTPTIAEAGYPGVEAEGWHGFVASSKTPPDHVKRLRDCATRRAERSDLSGSAEKAGRDRGRIRPRRVGRADPHRQRQMGCDHHVREYQGRLGTACGEYSVMLAKVITLAALLMLTPVAGAGADDYPSRPVRIVVPYPAGGPSDVAMRLLAEPLSRQLGQSIVIENCSGGAGQIGVEAAVQADRDGYTLVVGGLATQVLIPTIKTTRYDPAHDFIPLGQISSAPQILTLRSSLGHEDDGRGDRPC